MNMLACSHFLLLRTYYYIVYTVCYWSCLCCYRMLPSVKTYINHSFGQQEKKYSNSNNKIKHFRMGTIASRVRVWVSVCVCDLNWIHTNTHHIYVYCPILFEWVLKVYGRYMDHGQWTIGIAHKKALIYIHSVYYTHTHCKSCNKWKCEHTRTLYERTVTICGGGGGGSDGSGSVDGKCCALKHEYYFGPQLPKHILIDFMLTEMPNGNPEKRFRN